MMRDNNSAAECGTKTQRLSLCMIVRNESRFIRGCLESVRNVVDEIVVVDTGSTDDTIEICRSFGARIFSFPWVDDFSAARNYGLEHATGDWILWLDADEVLEAADGIQLREAIRSGEADLFAVRLINYYGDTPDPDKTFEISHLRIFRNHTGIRFENTIHERLNVRNVEKVINLPVRVYHYGYMPSVIRGKDKQTRNVELLKRELENQDCSPWVHYHLASEYYNQEQYDVALQQLNVGILAFILSGLKPPSMCYRLKYLILLVLKQTKDALKSIDKALAIYPDYVDLHFIKGLHMLEEHNYKEAQAVFRHCTALGEDRGDHLTLKGVGSFRAWYYRGFCLEKMGQIDEALIAYEKALTLSPGFHPAVNAHTSLQQKSGL